MHGQGRVNPLSLDFLISDMGIRWWTTWAWHGDSVGYAGCITPCSFHSSHLAAVILPVETG